MPKKNSPWGVNSKAVKARERKAAQVCNTQETKKKAVEDAYWEDNNKLDQRKQEKKNREEQKRLDALVRKQDTQRLLVEEEAKISSSAKATTTNVVKKVTQSEIDKIKEKERKKHEQAALLCEKEKKKIGENTEMECENPNVKMAEMLAAEGAVEARSIGDAINVLTIGENPETPVDRHPEKRMKASYKDFEERELPRIKLENSNLRLSQLKQILRKEWQKSPDNPMNQR